MKNGNMRLEYAEIQPGYDKNTALSITIFFHCIYNDLKMSLTIGTSIDIQINTKHCHGRRKLSGKFFLDTWCTKADLSLIIRPAAKYFFIID